MPSPHNRTFGCLDWRAPPEAPVETPALPNRPLAPPDRAGGRGRITSRQNFWWFELTGHNAPAPQRRRAVSLRSGLGRLADSQLKRRGRARRAVALLDPNAHIEMAVERVSAFPESVHAGDGENYNSNLLQDICQISDRPASAPRTALKRLTVNQPQRLPGARTVTIRAVIVNDALCACNSVYGRKNQRTELIDQLVLEECTIDLASTLKK